MKSKLLSNIEGRREWALIFDSGDEAMKELKRFADSENLTAAHFTGIGAFSKVTVAWFDYDKREYQPIAINEQVELLSLITRFDQIFTLSVFRCLLRSMFLHLLNIIF